MKAYKRCYFFRLESGNIAVDYAKSKEPFIIPSDEIGFTLDGEGHIVRARTADAYFYPAPACREIQR